MRKKYITPTLAVVAMQQRVALLSSSEQQFTVNVNEDVVDPEDTW